MLDSLSIDFKLISLPALLSVSNPLTLEFKVYNRIPLITFTHHFTMEFISQILQHWIHSNIQIIHRLKIHTNTIAKSTLSIIKQEITQLSNYCWSSQQGQFDLLQTPSTIVLISSFSPQFDGSTVSIDLPHSSMYKSHPSMVHVTESS